MKAKTAELQEQRDFLFASLRDLERGRESGELAEEDYLALKDDYTARAATVLRAMEAGRPRAPRRPVAAASPPTRGRRPLVLTLGVILAIVALTAGAVTAFSGQRKPGSPVTGTLPDTPAGRLSQALQLETDGKAADALKIYDDLIRTDPKNVQALAYRGWLLDRAGLPDLAMTALDQAVTTDPSYPDAHFFRGMVLYQDRKDPAGAVTEFRLFLSNNPPPEMVSQVEDVLRKAMSDAGMPAQ
ncbi:MAG: tetratricopeptide repeat protein [Actinomycetota bacterium]|nr:tetratricopeptide repeat protein [Actinomycetota bacterium]